MAEEAAVVAEVAAGEYLQCVWYTVSIKIITSHQIVSDAISVYVNSQRHLVGRFLQ